MQQKLVHTAHRHTLRFAMWMSKSSTGCASACCPGRWPIARCSKARAGLPSLGSPGVTHWPHSTSSQRPPTRSWTACRTALLCWGHDVPFVACRSSSAQQSSNLDLGLPAESARNETCVLKAALLRPAGSRCATRGKLVRLLLLAALLCQTLLVICPRVLNARLQGLACCGWAGALARLPVPAALLWPLSTDCDWQKACLAGAASRTSSCDRKVHELQMPAQVAKQCLGLG